MFKPGQKVRCKTYLGENPFEPDTIFVVRSVYDEGDFVRVNTLEGEEIHGAYYVQRFEAVD